MFFFHPITSLVRQHTSSLGSWDEQKCSFHPPPTFAQLKRTFRAMTFMARVPSGQVGSRCDPFAGRDPPAPIIPRNNINPSQIFRWLWEASSVGNSFENRRRDDGLKLQTSRFSLNGWVTLVSDCRSDLIKE